MIDHIYIFSYNRGQFLKNLVSSIERHVVNVNITVIDDCSTDLQTLQYLNEIKTKHRVITPYSSVEKKTKHGNLYANKNWAINDARDQDFKYVYLVPEDVQLVRKFLKQDFKRIEILFDNFYNVFQCLGVFVEKVNKFSNIQNHMFFHNESQYFLKNKLSNYKRLSFNDDGIINVKRFFSLFEKFESSEFLSEKKAQERNLILPYDCFPHFAILPFNTYHRITGNNRLTFLINKIAQTGFYPYRDLSKNNINKLFSRKDDNLAFAEDWLDCPSVPNKEVWSFWGGLFNLEVYNDDRRQLAHKLQHIKESKLSKEIKHSLMIKECEIYLENHDKPNGKNTFYSYN